MKFVDLSRDNSIGYEDLSILMCKSLKSTLDRIYCNFSGDNAFLTNRAFKLTVNLHSLFVLLIWNIIYL